MVTGKGCLLAENTCYQDNDPYQTMRVFCVQPANVVNSTECLEQFGKTL